MLCHLLSLLVLPQVIHPPPRFERLENGLRVAIVEEHALPLVSVQLWYRVGSASDAIGQPGLCHVARTILEHRDDAALRLRAAGVRFESRTLRDACYFSSVLPPNFLEYVLDIEAGCMRPISVNTDMVETALGAAARDYGLNPDEPEQLAERRLLAAMFPGHPYQHPPGFVADTLKDLKLIDVQEFLDRWFVPGNATLFIIGDVSTVSALELARKRFGSLPWREPPRRAESKLPEAGTARISTTRADRTGIDIAWLTPPAGYFENAAFDVLMHRLCNPVDGPLCLRLLEAGCTPPRWHREAWRNAGMLVLSVDLPPDIGEGEAPAEPPAATGGLSSSGATGGLTTRALLTAEDLERIVREELAKMAETIPTEIEHNRARALAMRDVRNRRAAFGNRARILAAHEIVAGDLLIAEFTLPRLERVAVADVQQAALGLQEAQTVAATARRQSTGSTRPTATAYAGRDLLSPLATEPVSRLGAADALGLLRQHVAGAPAIESPEPPGRVVSYDIGESVKLTICALPAMEPVEVRTYLSAPDSLWDCLGTLMATGSAEHSVDQIRDYLTYHGLDILPGLNSPRSGLESHGPTARLAQMIALQAELLRHPNDSDAACARAAERLECASEIRARTAGKHYADGAYVPPGLIGWRTLAVVLGRSKTNLQSRLGRLRTVYAVEVVVVGDVQPAKVLDAARAAWAGWQPAEKRAGRGDFRAPWTESQPAGEPWTTISWQDWRTGPLQLSVSDRLAPHLIDQPLRELTLECIGRCLAVPSRLSPALNAERAWLWSWRVPTDGWFMYGAKPTTDEITADLAAFLDRLNQVRLGKISDEQGEVALRLARADRLLTLADATAIADFLQRGVSNPWDLLDGHAVQEFCELMPRAYRVQTRGLTGLGPVDRSAELKRFKHLPDGLWRPRSP